MRFPGVPEGEESTWQVDVVEHLKLGDWKVVQQAQDIDLVGAEWRRSSVKRTDSSGRPSAHGLLPLQRAARGGAFVHGDGGDQVFAGWGRGGDQ